MESATEDLDADPRAPVVRNTWPFPGFSTDDIRSYADERVMAVAANLMLGRGFITFEDDTTVDVPWSQFDSRDLDILPLAPVFATQQEARTTANSYKPSASASGITPVAFYGSNATIWLTLLNPQTAPRIFTAYPQALEAARPRAGCRPLDVPGLLHLLPVPGRARRSVIVVQEPGQTWVIRPDSVQVVIRSGAKIVLRPGGASANPHALSEFAP